MRTRGVPSFPDPTYGPPPASPPANQAFLAIRGAMYALPPDLSPRSPAFMKAAQACGLGPRRGQRAQVMPAP